MKRKQRAVFPLAATVLLPQHESPPMYYHVQEAGLSAQKMGGSSAAFNSFCIFLLQCIPVIISIVFRTVAHQPGLRKKKRKGSMS